MKLREFIARIENINLEDDKNEIMSSLIDLSNNRTLLSEHLIDRIKSRGFLYDNDLYGSYVFELYGCEKFTIRLIFWLPASSQDERENFIYGLIHSHDFELYVVGYSGDGYRTIKREVFNPDTIQAGRRPKIGRREEIKLNRGVAYHMRKFHDIHHQLPPDKLSSSLSLIVHAPNNDLNGREWCFDKKHLPIYSGIGSREIDFFDKMVLFLDKS